MVRFEEKKLVIEVECYDPVSYWLELHTSLCDIVRNVTSDNIVNDTFYSSVDFLNALLPDLEQSKRMKCK